MSKSTKAIFAAMLAICATALPACSDSNALPGGPNAKEESNAHGKEEETYPEPTDPQYKPGLLVFAQLCHECHIDSEYAPEISDTRSWTRRAKKGTETLYQHAIEGFGDMPARGGDDGQALSDDQIRSAVDYMLHITLNNTPPE